MLKPFVPYPGECFAWSYGIIVQKQHEKGQYRVNKAQIDGSTSVEQDLQQAAQASIGVIYNNSNGKSSQAVGTGVIVRLFREQTDPLYQRLQVNKVTDEGQILGIVMTARHLINHEDGTDNTLDLWFSLQSSLPTTRDYKLCAIDIAGTLYKEPVSVDGSGSSGLVEEVKEESNDVGPQEQFLDPINLFEYGINDDVEIMLLVGKSSDGMKEAIISDLPELSTLKEKLYCIGYPGSVKYYLDKIQKLTPGDLESFPQEAYAQTCPEMHNIPEKERDKLKLSVISALIPDIRNYIETNIKGQNDTMIAVSASAYKGMSGGPLCFINDKTLNVLGIVVGSAACPMGKLFSYMRRNLIQGKLSKFPLLNKETKGLVELFEKQKKSLVLCLQQARLTLEHIVSRIKDLRSYSSLEEFYKLFQSLIHEFENDYRKSIQLFIEYGLSCNHNLVLRNCSKFREIKAFLSDQTIAYKSSTPKPYFLPFLIEYANQKLLRIPLKNLQSNISDVQELKDPQNFIQQLSNALISFNVNLEENSAWRGKIAKWLFQFQNSQDAEVTEQYLGFSMKQASKKEKEVAENIIMSQLNMSQMQINSIGANEGI